ncbi:MAG: PD-(D/E)XK nuclease domain-containing protein, partial [Cytophagales bacterium]
DKGMTEGEIDYYTVSFSNKEVRESFNEMLLGSYLDSTPSESGISVYEIRAAFLENDLEKVKQIIETMFHSLPVELFEKKDKNGKIKPVGENFYHAIIYLIFNLLGVKMKAEVMVQNGRIDAIVETTGHIYLFEFKKDRSPDAAIQQIQNNEYFKPYLLSNKVIHLIGVRFSLENRGIDAEKDWKELILNG